MSMPVELRDARLNLRAFFHGLKIGVAVLLGAAVAAGCGRGSSPAPNRAPVAVPVKKAGIAGVETYREALTARNSEEALRLLEQAVRTNPRLAEAWYEVGRLKVKLAPGIVKTDEVRGIQVFREGLEAQKEALRLLDAGSVTVWSVAEEDQARTMLATDLANADETLADQDALLRALRLRTY